MYKEIRDTKGMSLPSFVVVLPGEGHTLLLPLLIVVTLLLTFDLNNPRSIALVTSHLPGTICAFSCKTQGKWNSMYWDWNRSLHTIHFQLHVCMWCYLFVLYLSLYPRVPLSTVFLYSLYLYIYLSTFSLSCFLYLLHTCDMAWFATLYVCDITLNNCHILYFISKW